MIEAKKQMGRLQGLVETLAEENSQLRTRLQEMEKQLEQREKKLLRLERRIQQGGI
ncbi:hypothetical protein [Carboxydocella sp. JDF658]|uniref:hypothetical protein n=1 Tax=Carboxydocella sp. JDF658 TaxID=1926600 RepID=UPI0009CAD476|nr:hypothetical protein [Carboxydocella sp. JDF658]GAW32190.1 hypothetical protein JDF658_19550 [Carboxydocella sp. JDF658]